MDEEPNRSISLPELLTVSVMVLLLFMGAVFVWRSNPERINTDSHGSITATLTRIESAKARYAADNRLPTGTWLTLSHLQKAGYLSTTAGFPSDIHFVPGMVGENTTYHFADGVHKDHPEPPR